MPVAKFKTKKFIPKKTLLCFLLFALSSGVVLINDHVHGNQQHSLTNKIRSYRDEVWKSAAIFPASNLKVLLTLKDIRN